MPRGSDLGPILSMLLPAFTAIVNWLRLSNLENLFTPVMCSVQAMMPPALAQVLVSIAERLLSSFPEDSGTRVDADPEIKLSKVVDDIAGTASSTASEPGTTVTHEEANDMLEKGKSPDSNSAVDCPLSSPESQSRSAPKLVFSFHESPGIKETTDSTTDSTGKTSGDAAKAEHAQKSPYQSKDFMTSVATSPTQPKGIDPTFANIHTVLTDRSGNLDWCQWPVCMAYYMYGTCPFGEASCPDAHASADYNHVINDKGLVRVCFDALGVGGRMCLRRPGYCRFFHAPAHIRYQMLEIRHRNRQRNYRSSSHQARPNQFYLDSMMSPTTEWAVHGEGQPSSMNTNISGSTSTEATISMAAVVAALIARLVLESSHTQDTTKLLDRLVHSLSQPGRLISSPLHCPDQHCLISSYNTGYPTGIYACQHPGQQYNAF